MGFSALLAAIAGIIAAQHTQFISPELLFWTVSGEGLIVVVEPGRRSIDTAGHIRQLAAEIGLANIAVVGNKIRGPKYEDYLRKHLPDFNFLGFLPYEDALIEADLNGQAPFAVDSRAREEVAHMLAQL